MEITVLPGTPASAVRAALTNAFAPESLAESVEGEDAPSVGDAPAEADAPPGADDEMLSLGVGVVFCSPAPAALPVLESMGSVALQPTRNVNATAAAPMTLQERLTWQEPGLDEFAGENRMVSSTWCAYRVFIQCGPCTGRKTMASTAHTQDIRASLQLWPRIMSGALSLGRRANAADEAREGPKESWR